MRIGFGLKYAALVLPVHQIPLQGTRSKDGEAEKMKPRKVGRRWWGGAGNSSLTEMVLRQMAKLLYFYIPTF